MMELMARSVSPKRAEIAENARYTPIRHSDRTNKSPFTLKNCRIDDRPGAMPPEGGDGASDGETTAITVRITNEGPFDGAEVVQLYIRDEYASVTRPVKELKAFKRIFLKNGESTDVTFDITPEMLQCFGADNRWTVEPGEFTIMVGSSSADEDLQSISFTSE